MDATLYIAMTGAKRTMNEQSLFSNNLANVNTPGFRADMNESVSYYLNGFPENSQVYSASKPSGLDLRAGPIQTTNRPLDVAVNGEGWFVVQNAQGKPVLTRAGNFVVNNTGLLVNSEGLVVRGSGGPITIPPNTSVQVGNDGTISIIPQGEGPEAATTLDRLLLVNPNPQTLEKGPDGHIRLPGDAVPVADARVTVTPGALELSNVNAVGEMVNMINAQREFEVQLKLMQTVNGNQQTLARLLQI